MAGAIFDSKYLMPCVLTFLKSVTVVMEPSGLRSMALLPKRPTRSGTISRGKAGANGSTAVISSICVLDARWPRSAGASSTRCPTATSTQRNHTRLPRI